MGLSALATRVNPLKLLIRGTRDFVDAIFDRVFGIAL
jgi:hypothetical protein